MNSTKDLRHEFEYTTVVKRGEEALSSKGIKWMEKAINDAYAAVMLEKEKADEEGRNFVLTPSEFNKKLDAIIETARTKKTHSKPKNARSSKPKNARSEKVNIPNPKKGKKSKSNIKTKSVGKMKESGKVHRTTR